MRSSPYVGHAIACLLFGVSPPIFAATSNEIAQAIQNLGASNHKTREAATQFLSNAGTDAVPALEKAARDPDPEVRIRANEILPFARLGISTNTPPNVRGRLAEYLRSTPDGKQQIVQQLLNSGKEARPILIGLAQSEKNLESRVVIFEAALEPVMSQLEQSLQEPALEKNLTGLLDDLEFYQAMLPEDIQVPLLAIRKLDDLKMPKQADTIFDRTYQHQETVCAETPHNPDAQNNIAWLCAVARRRLDDGLKHIQLGLTETPNEPALLDTKAELLFQKGDTAKALELIAQCIAADPKTEYFQKQQARMKKGDKTAPPPRIGCTVEIIL